MAQVSCATLRLKFILELGQPMGREKCGRLVSTLIGRSGFNAMSARRHKKVEKVMKSLWAPALFFGFLFSSKALI
jgi:hypothetical protein